jgi:hypothetical protein
LYIDIGGTDVLMCSLATEEVGDKPAEQDEFWRLTVGGDNADQRGFCECTRLTATVRFRH